MNTTNTTNATNTRLSLGLISLLALLLLASACAPKAVETASTAPAEQAIETPTAPEPAAEKTGTPPTAKTITTSKPTAATATENTVEITANGFFPRTITVKAGSKVTWTNTHTVHAWPASAVHPTHRAYPGSDINKCNTVERDQIFDACARLERGESWSFTFTEPGDWKYHDHLNPGNTGTVIVE